MHGEIPSQMYDYLHCHILCQQQLLILVELTSDVLMYENSLDNTNDHGMNNKGEELAFKVVPKPRPSSAV